MDKKQLNLILKNHTLWLEHTGGDRADLQEANLQRANLQEADLQEADLQEANLQRANLQRANLRGADLDFSCWPLWCGSSNVKIDERLARQLCAHAILVSLDFFPDLTEKQVSWLNQFHRILSGEFPKIVIKEA